MHLGSLLKNLRKSKRWTLKKLSEEYNSSKKADMSDIHLSLLSMYERGKYQLSKERMKDILVFGFNYTPKEADQAISEYIVSQEGRNLGLEKVKEILNQSSSKLHFEKVEWSHSNLIPVFNSVGAGFTSDTTIEADVYFPIPSDVRYPKDRLFYAHVEGDSMKPAIMNGDYVLILKDEVEMIEGKIYAFWVDGRYTIKRFKKITDEIYQLTPNNPDKESVTVTPDMQKNIYPVGKVIRVQRRLD
jgi:phage repressor protein C with HTH and peptisase S24 domain